MKEQPPTDTKPDRIRIAVLGDADFAQATELLQGVTEFAESQRNWEVLPLHYTQEHLVGDLILSKRIDGVIGAFVSDRWIRSFVGNTGIPVVNTSNLSSITAAPSVIPDDRAIGRLVADHLLKLKFTAFAFGGLQSCTYSHERQAGFSDGLADAGFEPVLLPNADISRPLLPWITALQEQPQPVAVFCANDYIARRLILDATGAGLPVPRALSVIGVGNSALDSFFAGIGISSVSLPTHAIGYRAAQCLGSALAKPEPNDRATASIRIAPAGLIPRDSTGAGAIPPIVARALDRIASQLNQSELTVASLAHQLRASRRLIEIRFSESLEHSPHTEITNQRMALAKRLLLDPRIRIADIAPRCGYTELSHFYHRFKAAHNTTPAAWRKAALNPGA